MNPFDSVEIVNRGVFYFKIQDGKTFIYDSDYNEFLMRFEQLSKREVKLILTYFFSGFEYGKQSGREEKQAEIVKVLGL